MSRRLAILAGAVLLTAVWTVTAQQESELDTGASVVWESTSPGALAQRDPGRLVAGGIARFNDFQNFAFSPPEITQTSKPPKVATLLKVQALEALFENLNAALLLLDNAIRAQAGFAPYVPSPIRPDGTGGLPDLGSLDIDSLLGGQTSGR